MNNSIDVSKMSVEELQLVSTAATQERIRRLEIRQAQFEDEQIKRSRQLERKLDAQADMYTNALRAKQPREGWVNLRDFGMQFHISISNHRVGKLLRAAGIAQMNARTTVANREYMGAGRLCMNYTTMEGYAQKLWNYRRCMAHIDHWLESIGQFEQFYSIDNEKELERFIDALYDKARRSKDRSGNRDNPVRREDKVTLSLIH